MKEKIMAALIAAIVSFLVTVSSGYISQDNAHQILQQSGIEKPKTK